METGPKHTATTASLLITIDGPAGAGKTTVSKLLADRLNYLYVDTDALYRGVALASLERGVDAGDDAGLEALCASLDVGFEWAADGARLMVDGVDVTDAIRTPEVTMAASAVSAMPVVRRFLLDTQHDLGRAGAAVFEGRDMGTVVFPEANVKFYLDASLEMRAKRRFMEMADHSGQNLSQVTQDMARRDANDSSRKVAPLKPAADAIVVDSSGLTADGVVDLMLTHILGRSDPEDRQV